MNKRYKLLLKRLLLCSLLAGSTLTINSLRAEVDQPSRSKAISEMKTIREELDRAREERQNFFTVYKNNKTLLEEKERDLAAQMKKSDPEHVALLNEEINKLKESVNKNDTDLKNNRIRVMELEFKYDEKKSMVNQMIRASESQVEPVEVAELPLPPALSHHTKSRPMGPKGRRLPSRWGKNLGTEETTLESEIASTTATSEDVPLTQEAQECSICIENIEPNNHDGAQLTCNHTFHKACIDDWFKAQTDKNIHKTCPLCRKDFNNENPFKVEPSTDEVPTLEVAQAAAQIKEQQNILANLEETKAAEEKELVKTETKLEEVKVLPLEPVAPIKKKVARHRQKIAQKVNAIGVCKRKIYLLKQAELKAARRAAAQQNAGQPKKQQSVQDFYGVKKTSKRKSRVRGSRVARRGPARKKTTKRGASRKKSNKHGAKRKGSAKKKSAKRKQARRQAQQTAE